MQLRAKKQAEVRRLETMFYGAGSPVLDALRISGEVVNNLPMREAVQAAAARSTDGLSRGVAVVNTDGSSDGGELFALVEKITTMMRQALRDCGSTTGCAPLCNWRARRAATRT